MADITGEIITSANIIGITSSSGEIIGETCVYTNGVISVNGKTGIVVLSASDVDALAIGYHDNTKLDTLTDEDITGIANEASNKVLDQVSEDYYSKSTLKSLTNSELENLLS